MENAPKMGMMGKNGQIKKNSVKAKNPEKGQKKKQEG